MVVSVKTRNCAFTKVKWTLHSFTLCTVCMYFFMLFKYRKAKPFFLLSEGHMMFLVFLLHRTGMSRSINTSGNH